MDDCRHLGDWATDDLFRVDMDGVGVLTAQCGKCRRIFKMTVKVDIVNRPVKPHKQEDCPLQMRGLAHKGLEV